MKQVTFQKNLIGLEDLLIGTSTVTQTRGTTAVEVTEINGSNLPYDATYSMADKVDNLQIQMDTLPNVVDSNGNLLTGLIDTSGSDLNLAGRIWRKTISGVEAHIYYGTELMYKYNPNTGDLILSIGVTGDMFKTDNLSGLANYATARSNLGLVIGTDVQAYNALLVAQAALTATTGTIEKTGANTVGVYTVSAAGKALIDDADASAQRTTLGLGTAAVLNSGTAIDNLVKLVATSKLPILDGSNLTNVPIDQVSLQSGLTTEIGFNSYYESAQLAFTSTFSTSLSHNLGGEPNHVRLELVCTVAEGGYTIGDVIMPKMHASSSNGGMSVWYSATQVGAAVYTYSGSMPMVTKTGSFFNLSPTSWKLRIKAWK